MLGSSFEKDMSGAGVFSNGFRSLIGDRVYEVAGALGAKTSAVIV